MRQNRTMWIMLHVLSMTKNFAAKPTQLWPWLASHQIVKSMIWYLSNLTWPESVEYWWKSRPIDGVLSRLFRAGAGRKWARDIGLKVGATLVRFSSVVHWRAAVRMEICLNCMLRKQVWSITTTSRNDTRRPFMITLIFNSPSSQVWSRIIQHCYMITFNISLLTH